jgi:hypothetical protein
MPSLKDTRTGFRETNLVIINKSAIEIGIQGLYEYNF